MSQDGSSDLDDLIEIGHVLGVHGVKGQVKVYSNTSPRQNIVNYSPWVINQGGIPKSYDVSGFRQGKNVIARIKDITDRDQAMELIGARISISRHQLPELGNDDYYWTQLVGLDVVSKQGEAFGSIDHMLETGANDVMVVQGDRERLIPYVMDEVVLSIDLDKNQIVVDWDADF